MLAGERNPRPSLGPSSQPGFWVPPGVHNLRAWEGLQLWEQGRWGNKGKEGEGRGRENQGSERDKENLYPLRVGCGGGGGAWAEAAAFSSTAPVVAMATRALAIPSDIKKPPPARSGGAADGRVENVCSQTHARPPRGPGKAGSV